MYFCRSPAYATACAARGRLHRAPSAGEVRRAARGGLRRLRAGKSGLYGAAVAAPRPVGFRPETFPGVAVRPAGKSPGAFPRPPFSASTRNASAYIVFYITAACVKLPLQTCSGNFTRGLNARVHSAFCPRAATPARGSLARPLRARGLPARTDRVWAADVCGCYKPGPRSGACGNSRFPQISVSSVSIRFHPFGSAVYFCRRLAYASAPFHLSSLIIHH